LVIGTSARSRSIPWPVLMPEVCAGRIVQEMVLNEVALVFGREDRGLSNEELQLCNYHVQIPANPDYSSLNLGAAVMVLCYEIYKASIAAGATQAAVPGEEGQAGDHLLEADWDQELATAEQLEGFLVHMERVLIRLNFHDPDNPRKLMARLRRLYGRIRPDKMEINILRGILSATEQAVDKAGKS
ncbi:MAG: TrmH family RNA methyltransferase, partial [Pseudomonadales bacterium]|nr:TrmH family RNA methyltransferase [Pseudomonadales bacterium]